MQIDQEFLLKHGMSEEEFKDVALRGVSLYQKYQAFIKNKTQSYVCLCGKKVAYTRKNKHMNSEFHKKRTTKNET